MIHKLIVTSRDRRAGFTIIELLLVIAIIGVIIAVIVPRAWRANIEAKYGAVRQAATELGSWGITWAERNQESQDNADTCVLDYYVATLVGYTGVQTAVNNWTGTITTPTGGCHSSGSLLTYTVDDIMSQEKQPRNPFNGLSYFKQKNDGNTAQSGLLYLYGFDNTGTGGDGYWHYYFVYTGTDSIALNDWHAGMGSGLALSLAELRNGIFMARLRP